MLWAFLTVVLLSMITLDAGGRSPSAHNNEFAEFDDFEDDEFEGFAETERHDVENTNEEGRGLVEDDLTASFYDNDDDDDSVDEEDEVTIESDDDDFEHFNNEDEFENFAKDKPSGSKLKSGEKLPDLQMTKVPLHLYGHWNNFYFEMLLLAGLGVYFLNFLAGKTKNSRLATAWFDAHKDLLEAHFAIVGDDGSGKEPTQGVLVKESENIYALWCSGRSCVEGMLVELRLLKRQDLVNVLLQFLKPASDRITIRVTVDEKKMDKFVFVVAQKKAAARICKDMYDLSQYTEKKSVEKFNLPESYQLYSECGEASTAMLDKKVCQVLSKYEGFVEYIHISDQFSGPKSQDDPQAGKVPAVRPSLMFSFIIPDSSKFSPVEMETLKPLLQLVFHLLDKVTRFQLSKESRGRADKKRQKVEEQVVRASHGQRQEAAQQRREDKIRADKERLMNEEDPEKARKLEERDSRRNMKKKHPKMKMMKIKAM